jgi:tellurite resistance protein
MSPSDEETEDHAAKIEEAKAIWRRFDETVEDDLLRAVSAAFAFVACADAELADAEVERFLGFLRDEDAFQILDADALEARFRELATAFATDFEDGERRATAALTAVKEAPDKRALVLRAAQVAMVADENLRAVEEAALARLCQALGEDPSDW